MPIRKQKAVGGVKIVITYEWRCVSGYGEGYGIGSAGTYTCRNRCGERLMQKHKSGCYFWSLKGLTRAQYSLLKSRASRSSRSFDSIPSVWGNVSCVPFGRNASGQESRLSLMSVDRSNIS